MKHTHLYMRLLEYSKEVAARIADEKKNADRRCGHPTMRITTHHPNASKDEHNGLYAQE